MSVNFDTIKNQNSRTFAVVETQSATHDLNTYIHKNICYKIVLVVVSFCAVLVHVCVDIVSILLHVDLNVDNVRLLLYDYCVKS